MFRNPPPPSPTSAGCWHTLMALFTYEDVQAQRNIDLTDPNGQELTTNLIEAATAWVSRYVGYGIEQAERIHYFSDGCEHVWLPTNAPVSALALATKTVSGYTSVPADRFDWTEQGEVQSFNSLPSGLKAVRATYTAGWTSETLPADLRDALIDMVVLKLQGVNNFSTTASSSSEGEGGGESGGASTTVAGALKKFTAGSYSEEYSTAESDAYWRAKSAQLSRTIGDGIPASIKEVVASYRLVAAY